MTETSFCSQHLTSESSLNHVVLRSACMTDINGRLAQDACSRNALHTLATCLGLKGLRPNHLADDLATALISPDAKTVRLATAALHTFGLRLGALISTLRDPATVDRQADTPHRRAFLAQWLTVDSIWLAGGLLAGRCGPLILASLEAVTASAPNACPVAVLPQPELAPLIGAARHAHAQSGDEAIVVADLGHTRIKTGVADRQGDALRRLRRIHAHPVPSHPTADDVEEAVVAAFAWAIKDAAGSSLGRRHVVASVASFVVKGLPADDGQGIYGYLAKRTPAVLDKIENATGISADLRYLHDGTAAASAADTANSATITVGTWLGVGFRPFAGPPLLAIPQPPLPITWAGDAYTSTTTCNGRSQGWPTK